MAEIWGIATAVIGGAVVGAVGSNMAAGKQASADEQAENTQEGMFNTIVGQEQPYLTAGNTAESQLTKDLPSLDAPFTASDYLANQDPGYQFQLQTGAQATRNADTPGVGSLSGPALKDLMSFNQSMAATGYQNAFNRYQTTQSNTYNRLMGISQLGQNAASNTGTAGATLGTGVAQAEAASGAATAGGIVGSTNAIAGAGSTGASLAYLSSLNAGNAGNGLPAGAGSIGEETYSNYCDYHLKEHIAPILFEGQSQLWLYRFNYKGETKKHIGYIAQEVQEKYPEAVSKGAKGFLMVDYSKVPSEQDWLELDRIGACNG